MAEIYIIIDPFVSLLDACDLGCSMRKRDGKRGEKKATKRVTGCNSLASHLYHIKWSFVCISSGFVCESEE